MKSKITPMASLDSWYHAQSFKPKEDEPEPDFPPEYNEKKKPKKNKQP